MAPTTLTPERIVLGLHVAAGVVALLAGLVALSTEKGGARHRRAGRFYVRSMAVVVATVPVLFAFDPTDVARQFLVLVAIFSGYLVFSGYRALSRKRPTDEAAGADWLAAAAVAATGIGLGGWGVLQAVGGSGGPFGNIGIVMVVFGGISIAAGGNDLLAFRDADRRGPWLAAHLSRMIGGYIATVTAVSVVNFTALLPGLVPDVVAWLWPTAVGVPLIWYFAGTHTGSGPLASVVE